MNKALRCGLLAALIAIPAAAKDVAGVSVPETVTVEGKALKLNGAGIRKKFIIKVYVGALYLENASTDANAIVTSEQVKHARLHFLRDVGKEKIIEAFKEGFHNNSAAQAAQLSAQLDQIAPSFTDLKEGTDLQLSYVPGKGSIITPPGGKELVVPGKEFGDALFRNWLGPKPADDDLKQEMLAGHP